jgi:hypothetical protein
VAAGPVGWLDAAGSVSAGRVASERTAGGGKSPSNCR